MMQAALYALCAFLILVAFFAGWVVMQTLRDVWEDWRSGKR